MARSIAASILGSIYTHDRGVVLRTTYHVFDLYVNRMGDEVIDLYAPRSSQYNVRGKDGAEVVVPLIDVVATRHSATGKIAISAVNKHASTPQTIRIALPVADRQITVTCLSGNCPDDYNDVDRNLAVPFENDGAVVERGENTADIALPPHSISIIEIS